MNLRKTNQDFLCNIDLARLSNLLLLYLLAFVSV